MERPGRLESFRKKTVAKGDALFAKFPHIAPVAAPAPISGIHGVAAPIFVAASVVMAVLWTLSTGLVAYFLGGSITDVLKNIGVTQRRAHRSGRRRHRPARSLPMAPTAPLPTGHTDNRNHLTPARTARPSRRSACRPSSRGAVSHAAIRIGGTTAGNARSRASDHLQKESGSNGFDPSGSAGSVLVAAGGSALTGSDPGGGLAADRAPAGRGEM